MFGTRYNLHVGDRIIVSGRECQLLSIVQAERGLNQIFQLQELLTGRIELIGESAFRALYGEGHIRLLTKTERTTDVIRYAESFKPNDPAGDAAAAIAHAKAWKRLEYLKAFDENPVSTSTAALQRFIDREAERLSDDDAPSPGSLRRWNKQRGTTGQRRLNEMFGRHPTGRGAFRIAHDAKAIFEEEAERYYDNRRVTAKDIWIRVAHRVAVANETDGCLKRIDRPALSTIGRWLDQSMDFNRVTRREGRAEAFKRFGVVRGSMKADSILDVAIIDHTDLDCFVIDDVTHQPIGTPRLTVVTDSCSRMILGFNLGWKSASLEAVMAALRHAIKPKDYVSETYPHILHEWVSYGQPRTIVVDQGLEFMGTVFEDVCANLGINIEPAPAKTPEYKGQIERWFGTLNDALIHKLPGSRFAKPHILRELGVDPQKTAVRYLSEIEALIHEWIIDNYAREKHSSLNAAPQLIWENHLHTDPIELCPDLQQLDRACTFSKVVRLKRDGITLHNLVYRSPVLDQVRRDTASFTPSRQRSSQGSTSIKIRWDPTDLGQIFVMNPASQSLVPVPCITPEYAKNLNVHFHQKVQEFAAATNAAFHSEAQMVASRHALLERIDPLRPERVLDRKRLQRLRGPERDAQRDLVELRTVDSAKATGRITSVRHVGIAVETAVYRDASAPKESRPLLGGRRKSQKPQATPSVLTAHDESATTASDTHPVRQSRPAFNFKARIESLRSEKGQ